MDETRKNGRVPRHGEPHFPERDAEIARLRRSGQMTLAEIGRKFGVSPERVRQIAERSGVDPDDAKQAVYRQRHKGILANAESRAEAVLMRYIAGEDLRAIARELDLPRGVVRELLDEHITDEIERARRDNRMTRLHPDVTSGPLDPAEARDDRYWTEKRCLAALFDLAAQNGGRLLSSSQYQQYAKGRDDLPSFATVRNRVGRWSHVKVTIHKALADQGLC